MTKTKKAAGAKAGRRPVKAVKVAAGPSRGFITICVVVGLLVVAGLGYVGWQAFTASKPATQKITGLINYRDTSPAALTNKHKPDKQTYPMSPPVGGDHNAVWQNRNGDVYPAPIPNEHAVHSLEHGAVWVTYRPDLPREQVDTLAQKVRGKDHMLMSPFEGLSNPISLQAWGYQLKLDSASHPRIDEFVRAFRITAAPEPGAPCSGGNATTGTEPHTAGGMK